MFRVIPDLLAEKINKKLDEAYKLVPEAEKERDFHFNSILDYFDEYGVIPDFTLAKKDNDEKTNPKTAR